MRLLAFTLPLFSFDYNSVHAFRPSHPSLILRPWLTVVRWNLLVYRQTSECLRLPYHAMALRTVNSIFFLAPRGPVFRPKNTLEGVSNTCRSEEVPGITYFHLRWFLEWDGHVWPSPSSLPSNTYMTLRQIIRRRPTTSPVSRPVPKQ